MIIVVALGGNAISRMNEKGDIPDQVRNSQRTAEHIVDLVEAGHKVVTTHGNGPQVGNVLRRVEASRDFLYTLPLDICGAHTQGGMGYVLQREITNVFAKRGIDKIRRQKSFRDFFNRYLRVAPTQKEKITSIDESPIFLPLLKILNEKERTALSLQMNENYSAGDIGGILNCSENAARVTLFRAKQKLKQELLKHNGTPGKTSKTR